MWAAVLVAVSALVGGACGSDDTEGSGADGSDPSASASERALPTAFTGPTTTLAIAAHADLSDDDGPFPTFDDDVGFGGYLGNTYTFGVYPADSTTVAGYGTDDYGTLTTVEAWFDSTSSPSDAGFGIVCRLQDDGKTYYRFGVGNDGTYSISLVVDDEATVLTGGGQWVASDLIDPADRSFLMEATCDDDELTLTVGNEVIDSVTDSTLTSGGVGVFAKTFTLGEAAVDLSVFEAIGYLDPDTVEPAAAEEFEHFFGSRPGPISRCDLGDVAETGLTTEPIFVASCDGILYAYTDTPRDAERIFAEILEQTDVELDSTERFPDCTRRTDVRGPLSTRAGEAEVACIEVGDETLITWVDPQARFVGALTVPAEADNEFTKSWAQDWWPFTAEMKPG